MKSIKQLILAASLMVISCSFTPKSPVVTQGNVVHSFMSGKIQCQSQVEQNGRLTILLKSLSNDTIMNFNSLTLDPKKGKYILKIFMLVKNSEDSKICNAWWDAQEVTIVIDPLPVKEMTLTGSEVYSSGKATVLISEA